MKEEELLKLKQIILDEFKNKFCYGDETVLYWNDAVAYPLAVKQFLTTKITELLEERDKEIIAWAEKQKQRLDVGDFGADSVEYPNGRIWTQDKREAFNLALSDLQDYLIK